MAQQPVRVTAADRQLTCTHCGGVWYWPRNVVMSSSAATMFNFDAFSPESTMLSCAGCGKIEMFQPSVIQMHRHQG